MKASIFITCIVDQFFPQVGLSLVKVLRRLGVTLDFPPSQTCCGQPAFNSGFQSEARSVAQKFLEVFKESEYIVTPSGSCATMVKVFYKDLFKDDAENQKRAIELGNRVYEFTDFIVNVLGIEDVGASFQEKVALHQSCHLLRELNIRSEPQRLLKHVNGIEIVEMDRADLCCGFGGLFSIKYPQISGSILQEKIDCIKKCKADVVVATDMGCLMHMAGGLSRQKVPVKTMHIAEVLAQS